MQIISGDDLSAALAQAEQELVEDHLDHSLTPEEDELFRTNFLVSDERRQMLRETSMLREYADKFGMPVVTVSESATSLLDKLRAIFTRPAFAGAAVVAAVLIAALVWQVFIRDTSTPLEREYAALNQQDLSGPSDFSTISLISSNLRDSNSSTPQSVSKMTDTILLRLALPAGDSAKTFKAIVMQASVRVFTIPISRSYQNPNGAEVKILLPRSALAKGKYQIRLDSPGRDEPLTYSISTE
jgi:hypothetical protein